MPRTGALAGAIAGASVGLIGGVVGVLLCGVVGGLLGHELERRLAKPRVRVKELGAEARAVLTLFAFEVDEVLRDETLTAEEKVEKLKTLVKAWVEANGLELDRVKRFPDRTEIKVEG